MFIQPSKSFSHAKGKKSATIVAKLTKGEEENEDLRKIYFVTAKSCVLLRTLESDQFPLLNDPNKACIYVIKVKAYWNEKQIAQRTHKTSLNR